MKKKPKNKPDSHELWTNRRPTLTADQNISLILGSVKNLPIAYWKPLFFFKGARDDELLKLTSGRFPVTTEPGKTHPVISLKPLPNHVGYKVNPCSSVRSWMSNEMHFIEKGCRLMHTGYEMDRKSFVVEHIEVPLPAGLGAKLVFMGEVPGECFKTAG
ncbi:hypothetical protein [Desulfococcus sp.]|uniref:hypothetical protein n=1 Tax=Desulfococcus sp. TaxID=2025834 RepID=UPI0035942AD1